MRLGPPATRPGLCSTGPAELVATVAAETPAVWDGDCWRDERRREGGRRGRGGEREGHCVLISIAYATCTPNFLDSNTSYHMSCTLTDSCTLTKSSTGNLLVVVLLKSLCSLGAGEPRLALAPAEHPVESTAPQQLSTDKLETYMCTVKGCGKYTHKLRNK